MTERSARPGQFAFALVFVLASVVLLSMLGDQTVWSARKSLTSQPRFWPVVGLVMMVGFGAIHFWSHRKPASGEAREIAVWLRGLEYVGWFGFYVALVPVLGYLPASILVAIALGWRVGFRSRQAVIVAAATALGIVVVFRAVLRVHVPGGWLYHQLPEGLSSIMLTYF